MKTSKAQRKRPDHEQTLSRYFEHPEAIRRGLKAMEGREREILDTAKRAPLDEKKYVWDK